MSGWNQTCTNSQKYIVEAITAEEATKDLLDKYPCERCHNVFHLYNRDKDIIDTMYVKVPSKCYKTLSGGYSYEDVIVGGGSINYDEVKVHHVSRIQVTKEMMNKTEQQGGNYLPWNYANGVYFVKINTESKTIIKRFVKI